jgi:DNA-binding NarL/FixJ family response regulator
MPAKILLVDDEPLVRYTVGHFLAQQSGWEIYEAENGKIAVDRTSEIRPDVVVLDIMMPQMSGLEAARQIRSLAPETKIVLMSSYYTPEEAAYVARLFGDGNFIEKPAIASELIPAISRLLPEKAGNTEPASPTFT